MNRPGTALLINSFLPSPKGASGHSASFHSLFHPQIFQVVTNSVCPRRRRHSYFKTLLEGEAELVGNVYMYIGAAQIHPAGEPGSQSSPMPHAYRPLHTCAHTHTGDLSQPPDSTMSPAAGWDFPGPQILLWSHPCP